MNDINGAPACGKLAERLDELIKISGSLELQIESTLGRSLAETHASGSAQEGETTTSSQQVSE